MTATAVERTQLKISARSKKSGKGWERIGVVTVGAKCLADKGVSDFFPAGTCGRKEVLNICRQMEKDLRCRSTEYPYRGMTVMVERI
jgi:hypothetical protein